MAASPHSDAGLSTSEYLAFQKSYRAVVTHFKAQPGDICDALFENGLIPPAVRDFVRNRSMLEEEKAHKLADTIIDKVELDPSVYHSFMSILKNEGPWAGSIVEQLEEAFKAEQAVADCDHSSEDSFHSLPDPDTPAEGTVHVKPQNVVSEARRNSTTPDSKFICPFCQKCTVMQFFSKAGCPKAPQHNSTEGVPLFPYLDDSALTKKEKIVLENRLMDDTQKMIRLFAETEHSFIVSLSSMDIDVPSLQNYAENVISKMGAKEDIELLKQSSTISRVFYALQPFKSFFHYEIIESIVRVFGSPTDHQLMDEYISKFNEFCERSVFQVPPNIFHDSDPRPGDRVFSVKLTKEGQASLIDVVAVRRRVAKILDIEVFALQLCCITEGCVCLRFLVSSQVAEKIFPLSESKVSALQDIHVTFVEGPSPPANKDLLTGERKFEHFKTQLASAVPASAASPHPEQKNNEFIYACNDGDIDKLIDVCLESLGIEGEAATELRAVALEGVFEGDISFISHLVRESGINLDEQDAVGGTALFWSSYNGHTKIAEMLIECGASLNVQTEEGFTALHAACQNGHDDTVKILMRAKADLNLQDNEGVTALYLTSQNGHVTTVQLLVEAGASLDVQRDDGHTALYQASFYGHHKVVDLLTNAGAAVDVQTEEGVTALHLASKNGHVTTVQLLVEAGASLDVQTNNGWTALKEASFNGHHKVVDLLTNAGAAVDVQNEEGYTALHSACQEGHDDTVKILMRAKADLNLQTNDGRTALYQASYHGLHKVVDLLTNAGAAVDVQAETGHSAFHAACQEGHDEAVKILMRAKADLNLKTKNGFTALHLASGNGHVTTVQLLVEAGASQDMQTNDGVTALYLASEGGHVTTVQLLVEAGTSLDVQTNDGRTALDVATQFQGADSAVVQTLTKAGAKSGKQLSDSSATHVTSEKSPQQLKPSSGVGHQALVKTDGQAPKPLQQLKSSGSVQHNKPSGMSLIKLVKTGRSFVTSKLRGPKKTKSDHSNLQKSNRRSKEKTVYVPAAD